MKKIALILSFCFSLSGAIYSQTPPAPNAGSGKLNWKLKVSENGHYLVQDDGKPFFWLGDTGWEMLHRLSRKEIEFYLENRRLKGFNVIQTVIISEFIHSDKATNYYNDSIFVNENPEKPLVTPGSSPQNGKEYDFWDHVDFAVKTAEIKDLYVALVPSWGEWVIPRTDKPMFNTMVQAYNYGWFIGNRYKDAPNLIWILGGDRHPDERPEGVGLWRAMAEGIADGVNGLKKLDGKADYSSTLMTHHSFNSSSDWFHYDEWIDFHMWGSYHAEINNSRNYELAFKDWNLPNPKPAINGEPCYEAHGINYAVDDNGYFTSTDVRLAAYWSVFSGSAGFTYGSQPVWQFTDTSRKKLSLKTLISWQEGLDLPGAEQIAHLKRLIEPLLTPELVPDQSLIAEGEGNCGNRACALRNKSTVCIYIPTGNTIKVKMGIITGRSVTASWFDPRTGDTRIIGEYQNSGSQIFEVPGMSDELPWLKTGRGCDWVLILKGQMPQ